MRANPAGCVGMTKLIPNPGREEERSSTGADLSASPQQGEGGGPEVLSATALCLYENAGAQGCGFELTSHIHNDASSVHGRPDYKLRVSPAQFSHESTHSFHGVGDGGQLLGRNVVVLPAFQHHVNVPRPGTDRGSSGSCCIF